MKIAKSVFYHLSGIIPTSSLQNRLSPTLLLPYHHLVSNQRVPHVKNLYDYKNVQQFTNDLDVLLKYSRPVTAEDVFISIKEKRALKGNNFLLTFDDGFREVYDIIAPILLKKGVPAIFFINPSFIDNQELFYRSKISLLIEKLTEAKSSPEKLQDLQDLLDNRGIPKRPDMEGRLRAITNLQKDVLEPIGGQLKVDFKEFLLKEQPFLTTQQVKALSEKGFAIGAHSMDHPYYQLLPLDEQIRQTTGSCDYVQGTFQQKLRLFSFPHADKPVSQEFFDRLEAAGTAPDLYFGTQNQKFEVGNRILHRFNAERPSTDMKKLLNGILVLMLARRFQKKEEVIRSV